MTETPRCPMVLVIRDGWGRNPNADHGRFNAVELASTPRADTLVEEYPTTQIRTSGEDVGLPDGTMGNSEVGHQNIGGGRVVDQESVRITKAIRSGDFFENEPLHRAVHRAKERGGRVHLMGIASEAGVHGLISHLEACLELCARLGHHNVVVHALTDGRDTGPFTGKGSIERIVASCERLGVGHVGTICGRYHAMDRDRRWERVARAYNALTGREEVPTFADPLEAVQDYYDHPTSESQVGDEFITPRAVGADWRESRVQDGDSVIFYNYRGDRPRELTRAFVMPTFYGEVEPSPGTGEKGFDRGEKLDLHFVTMTAYEESLNDLVDVAFPKPPKLANIAGEWLSKQGLSQFRCAETEKFAHVTFFFNDYREEPFDGEERKIIPSPDVPTYDRQPEMSASGVRDAVLDAIDRGFAMILVNFANGDMVGHTGDLDAAIRAVEAVDACVGDIVDKTLEAGGEALVTADHGNAEQMWEPTSGAAHTSHTLYDVDLTVVGKRFAGVRADRLADGRLADILPTALHLMGVEQPPEMTGRNLVRE